jgi:hypothetical protein
MRTGLKKEENMRLCRDGEQPHFNLEGKEWIAEPGDSIAEYNRLLSIKALKPLRWHQVERVCKQKPKQDRTQAKQEELL